MYLASAGCSVLCSGQYNDRRMRPGQPAVRLRKCPPIHDWHAHVEQYDVDRLAGNLLQGKRSVVRRADAIARGLQDKRDKIAYVFLVFDYQYVFGCHIHADPPRIAGNTVLYNPLSRWSLNRGRRHLCRSGAELAPNARVVRASIGLVEQQVVVGLWPPQGHVDHSRLDQLEAGEQARDLVAGAEV
jgi:hypothetical protein